MKLTFIALIIAVILVGGAFVISGNNSGGQPDSVNNVTIVDGKQIIDLRAKGGYSPQKSIAKAGIPTILRVNTSGTFDCSSAIRVPSMKILRNLPPAGSTEIDLGSPRAGILQGTCGMGMYPFEIDFRS